MVAHGCSFFFSSRRRHTRCSRDWSSDVCSSDLLAPHVEDAGGRVPELPVLRHALLDRRLVDRVGVAMLAPPDPAGEDAAQQVRESRDDVHNALLQWGSLVASSALMPSSRIFCCRFWRCMPISSAALVMLPP